MSLNYGKCKREANADFTLMDVLSYYRMAVVEDKRFEDRMLNSEPHLVAEAIAAHQSNIMKSNKRKAPEMETSSSVQSDSDKANEIVGVRLNGLLFYFYIIPVSSYILQAMEKTVEAKNGTSVKRSFKYDWSNKEERVQIINIFDRIRMKLFRDGNKSLRRHSLGQSGKTS